MRLLSHDCNKMHVVKGHAIVRRLRLPAASTAGTRVRRRRAAGSGARMLPSGIRRGGHRAASPSMPRDQSPPRRPDEPTATDGFPHRPAPAANGRALDLLGARDDQHAYAARERSNVKAWGEVTSWVAQIFSNIDCAVMRIPRLPVSCGKATMYTVQSQKPNIAAPLGLRV